MVALSVGSAIADTVLPQSATIYAPALEETAFLVDAGAVDLPRKLRAAPADTWVSVFAQLRQRDLARGREIDAHGRAAI